MQPWSAIYESCIRDVAVRTGWDLSHALADRSMDHGRRVLGNAEALPFALGQRVALVEILAALDQILARGAESILLHLIVHVDTIHDDVEWARIVRRLHNLERRCVPSQRRRPL